MRKIIIGFTLFLLITSCKFKHYHDYQYNNPYDPLSPNFDESLIMGNWKLLDFKHTLFDLGYYNIFPGISIVRRNKNIQLYLFGGLYQGFSSDKIANIEISGDTTYSFKSISYLGKRRKWCTVSNILSQFFIFGGDEESTYEVYNFYVDSPIVEKLPTEALTYGAVSVPIENNIILIGGESGHGEKNKYLWLFNPSLLKWTILDTLPEPISFASASILNNKLYIIGGFTEDDLPLDKIYIYDFENHKWQEFSVPFKIGGKPVIVAWEEKERIYCMGGFIDKNYYIDMNDQTYEIDLGKKRILRKKSIPSEIEFVYAAYWNNSKIYVLAKQKDAGIVPDYYSIYTFELAYF